MAKTFWARIARDGKTYEKVTDDPAIARGWHLEGTLTVLESGDGVPPWETTTAETSVAGQPDPTPAATATDGEFSPPGISPDRALDVLQVIPDLRVRVHVARIRHYVAEARAGAKVPRRYQVAR